MSPGADWRKVWIERNGEAEWQRSLETQCCGCEESSTFKVRIVRLAERHARLWNAIDQAAWQQNKVRRSAGGSVDDGQG